MIIKSNLNINPPLLINTFTFTFTFTFILTPFLLLFSFSSWPYPSGLTWERSEWWWLTHPLWTFSKWTVLRTSQLSEDHSKTLSVMVRHKFESIIDFLIYRKVPTLYFKALLLFLIVFAVTRHHLFLLIYLRFRFLQMEVSVLPRRVRTEVRV